uniref:Reverse transcriptase/retrotransposon-derived protein RNase H-like domain-containing protein n=1 Tax=Sinocyclocheilus rhinocerous TaxID=307959 RepID=A0A673JAZ5_9TELE
SRSNTHILSQGLTNHSTFWLEEPSFPLLTWPEGKVRAVTDFKTPTCVKQVRQFLGLTRYYRRFIHDYARHAEPLFALTRTDAAMDFLKDKLTSAPVLRFPDFSLPFFFHTDACDVGLGAALMQRDNNGRDAVVAYASRALHKSERPYSTPEKECLAIIWALEHFRPYIEGLHVTFFSDHSKVCRLLHCMPVHKTGPEETCWVYDSHPPTKTLGAYRGGLCRAFSVHTLWQCVHPGLCGLFFKVGGG